MKTRMSSATVQSTSAMMMLLGILATMCSLAVGQHHQNRPLLIQPPQVQFGPPDLPNLQYSTVSNASDRALPVSPFAEPTLPVSPFAEPALPVSPGPQPARSHSGPGAGFERLIHQAWDDFKVQFGKQYATAEEENFRREIFIENTKKIERGSMEFITGHTSFSQRLNAFADMLHHEFHHVLNGFNRTSKGGDGGEGRISPSQTHTERATTFVPSANVHLPERVDWRELGAVTAVKNQGLCGACYAFSASGALEGHNFRKTGELIELSPQNLIDCTEPYGNDGCLGGLMDPAFQYVKDNPGIDTHESYPYEARVADCRYQPENIGAHGTGFVEIAVGDEHGLQSAVATLGPVSVAIDAGHDSFQFYADGVYYEPLCKNEVENMNHAVLVVGYGTEPDGQQYWLVKNSYGPTWGVGGYIKIARNSGNHCGIASIASYPLV